MPDAPPLTITDPGEPGRSGDLLSAGPDRERRGVPRRTQALLLALALAVGAAVLGGQALLRDRTEQRDRAAAFAAADAVHLRGVVDALYDLGVGTELLGVDLSLVVRDGRPAEERVTGLALEGRGLTPQPLLPFSAAEVRQQLTTTSAVDCDAVAAGAVPGPVQVVLTVTAGSGVPHEQRLLLDAQRAWLAALVACDLPAPGARPRVEAYGLRGRLQLLVETVRRDDAELRLVAVSSPGVRLRLDGLSLPVPLVADGTTVVGLLADVVDCDAARRGGYLVQVDLTRNGVAQRRVAGRPTGLEPGSAPIAQALRAVVERSCG